MAMLPGEVGALMAMLPARQGRLRRAVEGRFGSAHGQAERGQISLLILGFTVIALMLIVGGVDVTAVQLARTRLLDAADGAALDASGALDNRSAYQAGLKSAISISDESVRRSAGRVLPGLMS